MAAGSHDVVLSSGFLAFAQHSGFLQAVEEVRSSSDGSQPALRPSTLISV